MQDETRRRLESADPDLVYPASLDQIESALSDLRGYVEAEPPSEVDIDSSCNRLAAQLQSLPLPLEATAGDTSAASQAFRTLVDDLRTDVTRLRENVATQLTQADSQVSTRVVEVTERVETLAARMTELEAAATELLAAQQTAFADESASRAQERADTKAARDQDDAAWTTARQLVLDNAIAEGKTAFTALLEQQREDALDALARLEELKSQAEDLVEAIGRTGVTEGFKQWEQTERESADRFRLVAIMLGIATAAVIAGGITLKLVAGIDDEHWDLALAIAFTALPSALGGVAAYAARESSKHRRNQVIHRSASSWITHTRTNSTQDRVATARRELWRRAAETRAASVRLSAESEAAPEKIRADAALRRTLRRSPA